VHDKAVPYFKAGKEMRRRLRQRLPAHDGARPLPCLRVVGDAGEQPPEPDRSREFATLPVDGADGSLILLGDDDHRWSMGRRVATGNNCQELSEAACPAMAVGCPASSLLSGLLRLCRSEVSEA
jgi:hypothetical protein